MAKHVGSVPEISGVQKSGHEAEALVKYENDIRARFSRFAKLGKGKTPEGGRGKKRK